VSIDRACVEASLPHEVVLLLDCVASHDACKTERRHLHVQSVSFWAPANIGPYSQAASVSILAAMMLLNIHNGLLGSFSCVIQLI